MLAQPVLLPLLLQVRRYMAEQLYIQMLAVQAELPEDGADSSGEEGRGARSIFPTVSAEDMESALDVLLISAWDGPLEQVRAAREELAGHLHIEIKTRRVVRASEGSAAMAPKASTAEHESYQSLLDDAARGGGY